MSALRIRASVLLIAVTCSLKTGAQPAATTSMLSIQVYPGLTITGAVGIVHRIEYTTTFGNPNSWIPLTNFALPRSPYFFVDPTAPIASRRFYRIVAIHPPVVNPVSNMVWIPNGTFTMGSPDMEIDRRADEGPLTQVTLTRGFWIGKHEITRRQFADVMGYLPAGGEFLDFPAHTVSWNEASNYCALLSGRERQAGRIPANYFYRLPTEAQWEYVARAGTITRFSHGDDLDYTQITNYGWIGLGGCCTWQVGGQKQSNPWGVYDMYGNVYEWCFDQYERYPGGNVVDWAGPNLNLNLERVVRGGMAPDPASFARSACRARLYASTQRSGFGFRIVLVFE